MSGRFVLRSEGQIIDFANDEKVMRKRVRTYKRQGVRVDVEDRWAIPFNMPRRSAGDIFWEILSTIGGILLILVSAIAILSCVFAVIAIPDCIFGVFGHTICAE